MEVKFPKLPEGFERIAVYYKDHDYVLVAKSNHHIVFFTWDGVSISWNTNESFIEAKNVL